MFFSFGGPGPCNWRCCFCRQRRRDSWSSWKNWRWGGLSLLLGSFHWRDGKEWSSSGWASSMPRYLVYEQVGCLCSLLQSSDVVKWLLISSPESTVLYFTFWYICSLSFPWGHFAHSKCTTKIRYTTVSLKKEHCHANEFGKSLYFEILLV